MANSVLEHQPADSGTPLEGLRVFPVETGRDQKRFLQLPWKLYAGDENWIPPLRQNQKEMVNYSPHPFYDDNIIQTFLATINDEPVGRIAALVNYAHNRRYKENRGFVGFFESIDNQQVANGLFAAASDWLVQQGMTAARPDESFHEPRMWPTH